MRWDVFCVYHVKISLHMSKIDDSSQIQRNWCDNVHLTGHNRLQSGCWPQSTSPRNTWKCLSRTQSTSPLNTWRTKIHTMFLNQNWTRMYWKTNQKSAVGQNVHQVQMNWTDLLLVADLLKVFPMWNDKLGYQMVQISAKLVLIQCHT